jgi:hypothetical protein
LDLEVVNLLAWCLLVILAFVIGRAFGIYGIVKAVTDHAKDETSQYPRLIVEKINDQFYAYVGDMFVAQSKDVVSLVDEISKNAQTPDFMLGDKFPGVNGEEHSLFLKTMLDQLNNNSK